MQCPEKPQVGLTAQAEKTDGRNQRTAEHKQAGTALVDDPANDYAREGAGHYGQRRSQRKLPDLPAHILNDWAQENANGRLAYAEEGELQKDRGSDDPPAVEESRNQPFIQIGTRNRDRARFSLVTCP